MNKSTIPALNRDAMKAAKGEAVSFLGRVREGFAEKTCLSWVLQEEYLSQR